MYKIILIVSIIKKKRVKLEKVGRILYKLCRNRMLQITTLVNCQKVTAIPMTRGDWYGRKF